MCVIIERKLTLYKYGDERYQQKQKCCHAPSKIRNTEELKEKLDSSIHDNMNKILCWLRISEQKFVPLTLRQSQFSGTSPG